METRKLKLQLILFNKLVLLFEKSLSNYSIAAKIDSRNFLNNITALWRKIHKVSHKNFDLND